MGLRLFTTQVCTILMVALIWLANQWITEGYGLNPFIAIPIATLLGVLPYPTLAQRRRSMAQRVY